MQERWRLTETAFLEAFWAPTSTKFSCSSDSSLSTGSLGYKAGNSEGVGIGSGWKTLRVVSMLVDVARPFIVWAWLVVFTFMVVLAGVLIVATFQTTTALGISKGEADIEQRWGGDDWIRRGGRISAHNSLTTSAHVPPEPGTKGEAARLMHITATFPHGQTYHWKEERGRFQLRWEEALHVVQFAEELGIMGHTYNKCTKLSCRVGRGGKRRELDCLSVLDLGPSVRYAYSNTSNRGRTKDGSIQVYKLVRLSWCGRGRNE